MLSLGTLPRKDKYDHNTEYAAAAGSVPRCLTAVSLALFSAPPPPPPPPPTPAATTPPPPTPTTPATSTTTTTTTTATASASSSSNKGTATSSSRYAAAARATTAMPEEQQEEEAEAAEGVRRQKQQQRERVESVAWVDDVLRRGAAPTCTRPWWRWRWWWSDAAAEVAASGARCPPRCRCCCCCCSTTSGGGHAPSYRNTGGDSNVPQRCDVVRFRGMIQDVMGVQVYSPNALDAELTGGRAPESVVEGSSADPQVDFEASQFKERLALYCIPIPGESEWVTAQLGHSRHREPPPSEGMPSRVQNLEDSAKRTAPEPSDDPTHQHHRKLKLPLRYHHTPAETANSGSDGKHDTPVIEEEEAAIGSEEYATQDVSMPPVSKYFSNFPHTSCSRGTPCIVYVYQGSDDHFKVNSVFEFFGVLEMDPLISKNDSADFFPEEHRAHNPPTSLVPRLHCIAVRTASTGNGHPLFTSQQLPHSPTSAASPCSIYSFGEQVSAIRSNIEFIRNNLIVYISHAIGGDLLLAEYILANMIARVQSRSRGIPVGKCSLNIQLPLQVTGSSPTTANCGTPSPPDVLQVSLIKSILLLYKSLVTKCCDFDLTVESMNSVTIQPHKDYTENRLATGALQLPHGTHLLLNETGLQPGKLNETGISNVKALQSLMDQQSVEYSFGFHSLQFETDIPVVIVSRGPSILSKAVDFKIHWKPTSAPHNPEVLPPLQEPEFLQQCRVYISVCRELEFTIPEPISKLIQDYFVQVRSEKETTINESSLHTLLTLARLISQSFAEEHLSEQTWTHVLQLHKLATT
ncbi:mini-chromosome maintenance complex-binding protein [Pelomyxa schiedti]|nr:mini-chromosome maintenance complex-binding protein [Pelomyxa schiedti]